MRVMTTWGCIPKSCCDEKWTSRTGSDRPGPHSQQALGLGWVMLLDYKARAFSFGLLCSEASSLEFHRAVVSGSQQQVGLPFNTAP